MGGYATRTSFNSRAVHIWMVKRPSLVAGHAPTFQDHGVLRLLEVELSAILPDETYYLVLKLQYRGVTTHCTRPDAGSVLWTAEAAALAAEGSQENWEWCLSSSGPPCHEVLRAHLFVTEQPPRGSRGEDESVSHVAAGVSRPAGRALGHFDVHLVALSAQKGRDVQTIVSSQFTPCAGSMQQHTGWKLTLRLSWESRSAFLGGSKALAQQTAALCEQLDDLADLLEEDQAASPAPLPSCRSREPSPIRSPSPLLPQVSAEAPVRPSTEFLRCRQESRERAARRREECTLQSRLWKGEELLQDRLLQHKQGLHETPLRRSSSASARPSQLTSPQEPIREKRRFERQHRLGGNDPAELPERTQDPRDWNSPASKMQGKAYASSARHVLQGMQGGFVPGSRRAGLERQTRDASIKKALQQQYRSLFAAFRAFDSSGQGIVSFEDFERELLSACLEPPLTIDDVERLWGSAAPDERGFISMGQLASFLGFSN
eukprot:TRINITY_DN23716_c0_g1_i1.p1 TRINITY_DN23716_c0_g1~~TRINITY_DN23716_c0_g1_i1.p1  ORF type:complete len:518 (+),score=92.14 TRINITY_DN23716_c0_g1_i1:88-1554(+)